MHLVRDCRPDIVKFVHFGRARGLSYVQLVHLREICRQPGCRPNIRDLKMKRWKFGWIEWNEKMFGWKRSAIKSNVIKDKCYHLGSLRIHSILLLRKFQGNFGPLKRGTCRVFLKNVFHKKRKSKKIWRWPGREIEIWYRYNNNVVFTFAWKWFSNFCGWYGFLNV